MVVCDLLNPHLKVLATFLSVSILIVFVHLQVRVVHQRLDVLLRET